MARAYRSRSRIVLDVLRAIEERGPIAVTPLIAASNLTHGRLTPHLDELREKGWIEAAGPDDRAAWRITGDGREVLRKLREIEDAMQDFGLAL